jgi:hypothetical protein
MMAVVANVLKETRTSEVGLCFQRYHNGIDSRQGNVCAFVISQNMGFTPWEGPSGSETRTVEDAVKLFPEFKSICKSRKSLLGDGLLVDFVPSVPAEVRRTGHETSSISDCNVHPGWRVQSRGVCVLLLRVYVGHWFDLSQSSACPPGDKADLLRPASTVCHSLSVTGVVRLDISAPARHHRICSAL